MVCTSGVATGPTSTRTTSAVRLSSYYRYYYLRRVSYNWGYGSPYSGDLNQVLSELTAQENNYNRGPRNINYYDRGYALPGVYAAYKMMGYGARYNPTRQQVCILATRTYAYYDTSYLKRYVSAVKRYGKVLVARSASTSSR